MEEKNIKKLFRVHIPSILHCALVGCWFTLAPYFGKAAPKVLNPYPTA